MYCPVLFFSLYYANRIIFRENKESPSEEFHNYLSHKWRKHIGAFAIGLNLCTSSCSSPRSYRFYLTTRSISHIDGMGIHASANPIEIFSREQDNIDLTSRTYTLIHFMDENLSHWIQFIPFFFAIGWCIYSIYAII